MPSDGTPNLVVNRSGDEVVGALRQKVDVGGISHERQHHGVEVRTLGYRLRSIPRQNILSYAAEAWNPLGGYGIRGIGNNRAFVWGNKVVHIKTTNGEVYLGHSDPQRIVRDLDLVMSYAGPS